MIVLASDFGPAGPYVGQMHAAVLREWPEAPVVHLAHDLPACRPDRAAYLLAAYADWFPAPATFVCVVDPGVGSERRALAVRADGRLFVGPENGLFEQVMRRAGNPVEAWHIAWTETDASASFHGRDVFAPAAARLARDGVDAHAGSLLAPVDAAAVRRTDWPDDRAEVLLVDAFGNLISGIRAAAVAADARVEVNGVVVAPARTFSDVPPGTAFWYANSMGLVEVAVNRGRAERVLRAGVGQAMVVCEFTETGSGRQ